MILLVNSSNPDGPWLRVIDAWTGQPIPATKVDTCTMQVYAGLGARTRNFHLRVDATATDEFKLKYATFVDPTPPSGA